MQDSQQPPKIPLPFGANAGPSFITYPTPTPSQIGITNGAASFYDGFPPNCFVPFASGGAGPFGKDFNGLLRQTTAGLQWEQAGGPTFYDSSFQTAIGGYPQGAVVASAVTFAKWWLSTVDNNVTNPDTGGAGWIAYPRSPLLTATTFYVNAATGSDSTGDGSAGNPWATLQHGYNFIFANLDANGNNIELRLVASAAAETGGLLVQDNVLHCPQFTVNLLGNVQVTGAKNAIWVVTGARLNLTGSGTISALSSPSGFGCLVFAQNGGSITITSTSALNLAVCGFGQFVARSGGSIKMEGPLSYTISGGGGYHIVTGITGAIDYGSSETIGIILTGTPNFSQGFAGAGDVAAIEIPVGLGLVTFTGSATGPKFFANNNGVINTFGAGLGALPGSTPGILILGGVYA